eukprot:g4720.t1
MGDSTDEEEEEAAQACATVERHAGKKKKGAQQRQRLQIKIFAPLEHLTRKGLYYLLAPLAKGETLTDARANFEAADVRRKLDGEAGLWRKRGANTQFFREWRKVMGMRVEERGRGGSGGGADDGQEAPRKQQARRNEAQVSERIQQAVFFPKLQYFKKWDASDVRSSASGGEEWARKHQFVLPDEAEHWMMRSWLRVLPELPTLAPCDTVARAKAQLEVIEARVRSLREDPDPQAHARELWESGLFIGRGASSAQEHSFISKAVAYTKHRCRKVQVLVAAARGVVELKEADSYEERFERSAGDEGEAPATGPQQQPPSGRTATLAGGSPGASLTHLFSEALVEAVRQQCQAQPGAGHGDSIPPEPSGGASQRRPAPSPRSSLGASAGRLLRGFSDRSDSRDSVMEGDNRWGAIAPLDVQGGHNWRPRPCSGPQARGKWLAAITRVESKLAAWRGGGDSRGMFTAYCPVTAASCSLDAFGHCFPRYRDAEQQPSDAKALPRDPGGRPGWFHPSIAQFFVDRPLTVKQQEKDEAASAKRAKAVAKAKAKAVEREAKAAGRAAKLGAKAVAKAKAKQQQPMEMWRGDQKVSVKRAKTARAIFVEERVAELAAANPDVQRAEFTATAGVEWTNGTVHWREQYNEAASRDQLRYNEDMEGVELKPKPRTSARQKQQKKKKNGKEKKLKKQQKRKKKTPTGGRKRQKKQQKAMSEAGQQEAGETVQQPGELDVFACPQQQ